MKHILSGAICAALAVSAISIGLQKLSEKDQQKQDQTTLRMKHLATGMMMYCADWDDQTPHYTKPVLWHWAINPYLKNSNVFRTLNPAGGEIRINASTCGVGTSSIPLPDATPMFYETKAWKDGSRVVSFWDGRAKVLTTAEWKKAEKRLHLSKKSLK